MKLPAKYKNKQIEPKFSSDNGESGTHVNQCQDLQFRYLSSPGPTKILSPNLLHSPFWPSCTKLVAYTGYEPLEEKKGGREKRNKGKVRRIHTM